MPTFILAVVCVVLIFILYIVSGGWKKYGGLLGIFKWIGSSAQTGTKPVRPNFDPPQQSRSKAASEEDAVEVLRQVYREFEQKCDQLARRIDQLEAQQRLQVSQSSQAGQSSPAQTENLSPSAEAMSKQDLYFAILDLLESGQSEAEIAAALAVDREDILYVRRIMSDPNR